MRSRSPRRALALTSESAGHPFRRTLPPHVLRVPEQEPEVRQRSAREALLADCRSFFTTYCAAFVIVGTFIA